MSMSQLVKLIETKFKQQERLIKDFDSKLEGMKRGFAQQVGETRKAVESLGKIIQTLSKGIDRELAKINKKPCMDIEEIFTKEEVAKLKSKMK